MKEQEQNQNRVIMAPIMAYMLLGYGLLYSVYHLESLTVRLLGYCYLFTPFEFSATAWHDGAVWIILAFPLTWPLLTLRALLLLLVAATCTFTEKFFTNLLFALEWLWLLLTRVASLFWQACRRLAAVLVRTFVTAASAVWAWTLALASLIRSGLSVVGSQLVSLVIQFQRLVSPVISAIGRIILRFGRWLWSALAVVYETLTTWFVRYFRIVWREFVVLLLWLGASIRTFGRALLSAIRISQRYAILGARATGRYLHLGVLWLMIRLRLAGSWLLAPLRWSWTAMIEIYRDLRALFALVWTQLIVALRALGRWLLVPLRWSWTALIDIYRKLRTLFALVWTQLIVALRALGRRLLVPLHWSWRHLAIMYASLLRFAGYAWRSLLAGLRWFFSSLATIWRGVIANLGHAWRWLVAIMVNIWRTIRAPLAYLWSSLLSILNRSLALVTSVWRTTFRLLKRAWLAVVRLWTNVIESLQKVWSTVVWILVRIDQWLLTRWRKIWGQIYRAWSYLKNSAMALWHWMKVGLQRLLDRAQLLLSSFWKPLRAIMMGIGRFIQAAWRRTILVVKKTRRRISLLTGAFLAWFRRAWELAKEEIQAILRRLFRSTGFWKRIFANFRQARTQLISTLSDIRASLGNRLGDIRSQLSVSTSLLRKQIQSTFTDLRLWLAETRQQAAESIKNIVPHG